MKLNSYLLKASVVGALGGLLFGFDTAVIAGTTTSLRQIFNLSPAALGFTVSIALWGTVVGSLTAGVVGQRIGGRDALRIMAVLYIVSSLGCAFSWNWPALVFFRFIGGLGIGGSSVLAPVYIAELAPAKLRGRLVGMFQINIVLGILLAYLSNFCVAKFNLGNLEWRWELGIAAAPALLFFIMLFGIPRSPRWLATQNRVDEAGSVLQSLGSLDYKAELAEIVDSIHLEKSSGVEPLFSRKYLFPIFLAISIGMFNQLAGINAILYYLNDIFAAAGFNKISSDLQAVAIGAMNLCATLLGMTLIDKLGRKTLLLIGSVGTAICLAGVAGIFLHPTPPSPTSLAPGRLHSLLRHFPRRGNLGLHQRSLPQQRPLQRPKRRQLGALDHERPNLRHLPPNGQILRRLPLRIFRRHDGSAILRSPIRLPRNQRLHARRNATPPRHRLTNQAASPNASEESFVGAGVYDRPGVALGFCHRRVNCENPKPKRAGRKPRPLRQRTSRQKASPLKR